jgi:hypothetical protein
VIITYVISRMSQYIVYTNKFPLTDEAREEVKKDSILVKSFHVAGFTSLQEMYDDLKGIANLPPLEVFTCDIEKKVASGLTGEDDNFDLSYFGSEGWGLNIKAVREFKNVPVGRSVSEIVAVIYYMASQHDYSHHAGIKETTHVYDVMSATNEVINPDTFDWNLTALINSFGGVMWLACFMDMPEKEALRETIVV